VRDASADLSLEHAEANTLAEYAQNLERQERDALAAAERLKMAQEAAETARIQAKQEETEARKQAADERKRMAEITAAREV
jgi:hypothetical protein